VTRQVCTELFRAGPGGRLRLVGTEFRGLGAGLPFDDEGGSVTIRGDSILIEGMDRSFDAVRYALLPLTEHRLRVGRREHDLLALAGGRQAVVSIARGAPARVVAALLREVP
jgi:hypothetical protein